MTTFLIAKRELAARACMIAVAVTLPLGAYASDCPYDKQTCAEIAYMEKQAAEAEREAAKVITEMNREVAKMEKEAAEFAEATLGGLVFVWLIFAVLFAIACMLLAGRYNRSRLGWFLLGFLLGLFGLIFLLCAGRKKPATEAA